MNKFLIVGGDERYVYLANMLSSSNKVFVYQLNHPKLSPDITVLSDIKEADFNILLLPMPCTREEGYIYTPLADAAAVPFSDIFHICKKGMPVFGGHFSRQITRSFRMLQCQLFDFTKDSQLSIYNSIATAEGAIAEAISHSKVNLHKKDTAVLGYGKCGRALCEKLKGFDCNICVCCRRYETAAQAYIHGYSTCTLDEFKKNIYKYSFIFNTIPTFIIDEADLDNLSEDHTIIDISSAPGGMNHVYIKEQNINGFLCPGLPGIYAPQESARYLYRTILENIEI